MSIEFVTRCAWCKKELSRKTMDSKVYLHDVVSDGICGKCKREVLKKHRQKATA